MKVRLTSGDVGRVKEIS
ncbi:MAG: hypothetical protein KAT88_03280 [Spirochaetes bacterium]|nr:hypothetical protein [Spirochaetota bacterium]